MPLKEEEMQVNLECYEQFAREVAQSKKAALQLASASLLFWGGTIGLMGGPNQPFVLLSGAVGVLLFGMFYARMWNRISLQMFTAGFVIFGTISMVLSTLVYGRAYPLFLSILRPLQFGYTSALVASCLLYLSCLHRQKRFPEKEQFPDVEGDEVQR